MKIIILPEQMLRRKASALFLCDTPGMQLPLWGCTSGTADILGNSIDSVYKREYNSNIKHCFKQGLIARRQMLWRN